MKKQLKAIAVNKHSDQDNRGLKQFDPKLIYLFGDPEAFVALGKFLIECGQQMKKVGPFHRHFRDYLHEWSSGLIDVVAERSIKEKPKKKVANQQNQAIATKRGSA